MKTIMVRYKTSSEAHAKTNASLIQAVFEELRAKKLTGLRYTSYCLADGLTFVHVSSYEGPGDNPIPSLTAFKEFQRDIKSRCAELPVSTELSIVDSYG